METGNTIGLIELEEMEFYAYHGCYEQEQVVGNRFLVNIAIHTNCSVAAETDSINDALNYVTVYELTKEQVMQNSHLLEHLTKRIIQSIKSSFPQIIKLKVKVSKMNPPMGGQMKCVSLTLEE
ncbi:dihydroneopterin aldolase [Carboxylicivirga linearis]|uniref:7,8-dihydroneopterin aldolase n=1 Tax=Carboxylicivirga linearis TaxID=1628157 RepID=A0ABS5K0U2_9BACT|nr:dihydroneopterin aldolase [Carboxylicivirga linearis]MBS2100797.1 dihydroneopterin aldolase [Carboxylicivirga linearis]